MPKEETKKLCGRCNKPKGKTKACCKCGRPTKYHDDIVDDIYRWLREDCGLKEVIAIDQKGEHIPHNLFKIPSRAALSNYLMVTPTTIIEWKRKHEKFSRALVAIDKAQEELISNYSAAGIMNPTIGKLMLHNHGYSDKTENKTEVEIKGSLHELANEIEGE